MINGNLREFFLRMTSVCPNGHDENPNLFHVIHDGCPNLDLLNSVDLRCLKNKPLDKEQWAYYALKLCELQYRKLFAPWFQNDLKLILLMRVLNKIEDIYLYTLYSIRKYNFCQLQEKPINATLDWLIFKSLLSVK